MNNVEQAEMENATNATTSLVHCARTNTSAGRKQKSRCELNLINDEWWYTFIFSTQMRRDVATGMSASETSRQPEKGMHRTEAVNELNSQLLSD